MSLKALTSYRRAARSGRGHHPPSRSSHEGSLGHEVADIGVRGRGGIQHRPPPRVGRPDQPTGPGRAARRVSRWGYADTSPQTRAGANAGPAPEPTRALLVARNAPLRDRDRPPICLRRNLAPRGQRRGRSGLLLAREVIVHPPRSSLPVSRILSCVAGHECLPRTFCFGPTSSQSRSRGSRAAGATNQHRDQSATSGAWRSDSRGRASAAGRACLGPPAYAAVVRSADPVAPLVRA